MKTVRFWVDHKGSSVLLKMRTGQNFHHFHSWDNGEGWSSECQRYEFDGQQVTCEWQTDGVDCDGRMQRGGASYFLRCEAFAGYVADDGTRYPNWKQLDAHQRDFSAEAMGY